MTKTRKNLSYVPKVDNEFVQDLLEKSFRGFKVTHVLSTSIELGVFETLREPMTPDAACKELGMESVTGRLLLDSLVGMHLLNNINGQYADTEIALNFFTEDSDMSLLPSFSFLTRNMEHWYGLTSVLTDGQPVLEMAEIHRPDRLRSYMRRGAGGSIGRILEIVQDNADLREVRSFLSIGAGSALCAIAVAQDHPWIDTAVLEHPRYGECGRALVEEYGTGTRILEGDYRDGLMGSYDVVFSSLSHACTDTNIAKQLADGVNAGGLLVVRRHSPQYSLDPLVDLDVNLVRLDVMRKGTLHHHGDEHGKEYIESLTRNGLYLIDRMPFSRNTEVMVFRRSRRGSDVPRTDLPLKTDIIAQGDVRDCRGRDPT